MRKGVKKKNIRKKNKNIKIYCIIKYMNDIIIVILLINISISFSRELAQMKICGLHPCEIINNITNNINKTRNDFFRFLLSKETYKLKQRLNIIKKITNRNIKSTYNKLLSKYYGYTYDYYSLSDNELTVIETILSLSY